MPYTMFVEFNSKFTPGKQKFKKVTVSKVQSIVNTQYQVMQHCLHSTIVNIAVN